MLTHTSWAPSAGRGNSPRLAEETGSRMGGERAVGRGGAPGRRLGEAHAAPHRLASDPRPNGGRGTSAVPWPGSEGAQEVPAATMRRGMVRALGIDFGEKRIGIAISDPAGRLAVPLTTLARRDDRSAMAAIAEIALREGVGRLVMGEPVRLDGTRGPAAARVRRFGERLAGGTALPLPFVDEGLTRVETGGGWGAAGVDPRREPERIDALAAQIVLQEE